MHSKDKAPRIKTPPRDSHSFLTVNTYAKANATMRVPITNGIDFFIWLFIAISLYKHNCAEKYSK